MSLPTALNYLTIFRMPRQRRYDLSRAVYWFPVVGLFIGGCLALSWWSLIRVAPIPVAALVVVIEWVWLTGGMHLDGLANTSEALLSWRSRASMHAILANPHIGALGTIALVSVLASKVVTLQNLDPQRALVALFFAPVFGRSAQLLASGLTPYAKETGVAVTAFGSKNRFLKALVAILPLGLAFQLGWIDGALVLLGWLLLFAVLVRRIQILLGGNTGGTLGALTEISEAWVLVAATVEIPNIQWEAFDPRTIWPL
ncbi:MAG: adenosylcobinamide-GDP ribazoletransferase [Fibrobacteria bacterium]|nr:adenosylcobinamide-GDP ribazoletransferase [Fibrobacteria bacterium]